MAFVVPVGDLVPQLPAFLAPNASLVGDVRFGPRCSVWFGAVLRGDINHVSLGADCNVQDNAVLHVSKKHPCVIGDGVSIGHGANVHACTVGDRTLIAMNACVLDGAVIGKDCVVAAGCIVVEGTVVPDGHLIAGMPGKVIGPVRPATLERAQSTAPNYVAYQDLYGPELKPEGGRR